MSERKKIDEKTKFQGLFKIWIEAYEKAILDNDPQLAKKVIDKACYDAVEKWTEYLEQNGVIFPEEIKSPQCDTIEQSIRHHITNLINGGMWTGGEDTQPNITSTDDGKNVLKVEIPVCDYKTSCQWALKEEDLSLESGKFRCQRLGCFLGAIKKYLNVPNEDNVDPETVDYFMFKAHTTNDGGCEGLLFIDKGDNYRTLMDKYLP